MIARAAYPGLGILGCDLIPRNLEKFERFSEDSQNTSALFRLYLDHKELEDPGAISLVTINTLPNTV
jgi:hypothetical protein